jgi:hypothetical protein
MRNRIDQKIKPIVVSMGNYAASEDITLFVTPIPFCGRKYHYGINRSFEFCQILRHWQQRWDLYRAS